MEPRPPSRRLWQGPVAAFVAVAVTVVIVAAVKAVAVSDGPASSTPSVPVVTAPLSTASTPYVASSDSGSLVSESATPLSIGQVDCGGPLPVLRVLQFNIRAAVNGSGEVDPAVIAAEIRAAHPDLVSLNEVDSNTRRTDLDEPSYLAGATGLRVVYGPNLVYDGGPFGNAVLTRFPVVGSSNLRLPGTPGLEPRGLLTVNVRVHGRTVSFSSTHLSDGAEGRESRTLQALTVADALRASPGPTILAGDLNSVPTDLPERILRQDLVDAQEEAGTGSGDTIPQASPSDRFDYVLYDHHFAVVPGSTRVRGSASSDHRSVFTELTLLPNHAC